LEKIIVKINSREFLEDILYKNCRISMIMIKRKEDFLIKKSLKNNQINERMEYY
jgi:hypothetical protein